MQTKANNERLQAYTQAVEGYLTGCFAWPEEPQQQLFAAMRYSLLAGGKRLRPIYVLEFCRLCGGDWHAALPFAAAIEMVHTYSLIHDDLPCMDNDDYRRGKPTNHKVFGEANAVLAGDALLTEAFGALAGAELPPERLVAGVRILSRAAGALGMVGGQVLDLAAEEKAEADAQDVYAIQARKTGALIAAACQLGVAAADGSAAQMAAAAAYADHVGLAFQIRDDILDVIGSQEKLGKATGMDEKKNTFVRHYGVARCEAMVENETAQALRALDCFQDQGFLTELSQSLVRRDH